MPVNQEPLVLTYSVLNVFDDIYIHYRTKTILGLQNQDYTSIRITKYDKGGLQSAISLEITKYERAGLQTVIGSVL